MNEEYNRGLNDGVSRVDISEQQAFEKGRQSMRLKNAGLYRQLFGETNRTYTSKELWEILDSYCPLFTEDQKKELRDNLYNSIMKKK